MTLRKRQSTFSRSIALLALALRKSRELDSRTVPVVALQRHPQPSAGHTIGMVYG
jgi:hypothetical protein